MQTGDIDGSITAIRVRLPPDGPLTTVPEERPTLPSSRPWISPESRQSTRSPWPWDRDERTGHHSAAGGGVAATMLGWLILGCTAGLATATGHQESSAIPILGRRVPARRENRTYRR